MYKTDLFHIEVYKEEDGKRLTLDLSHLIQGLSWKSSLSQAATVLTFEIQSNLSENAFINVPVGSQLKLSYGTSVLLKAIVTDVTKNANGALSVTASDNMYYLTKNMTTYAADNTPGKTIISDVFKAFNIPNKNLPDLKIQVKQIFRDMTLWNIVQSVVKEEKEQKGSSWHLRFVNDQVEFFKLGPDRPKWTLDSARLRLNGSISKNMNNLYTSFIVRGKDDKILKADTDQAMVDKYGKMVYQITDEEADLSKAEETISTLRTTMSKLEESFSVDCLGNHAMMCGDRIIVNDEQLDESGIYEVMSLSHSVTGGLFKSQIQLRRCHDEG